jgi:hypothetical protein
MAKLELIYVGEPDMEQQQVQTHMGGFDLSDIPATPEERGFEELCDGCYRSMTQYEDLD